MPKHPLPPPPAPTPVECQLGQLICDRSPYAEMTMPANWKDEIEWDAGPLLWAFRRLDRRVAKALRIPVIITTVATRIVHKRDGTMENEEFIETYKDWLLIGYEGAGGGN